MQTLKHIYPIFIVSAIFSLGLLSCKNTKTVNPPTTFEVPDRIDKVIKERIENNFERKVYLAKISLNKLTQYKFYGDDVNETTITKNRFEIGSVTKTFTGLMIYKLYKKGLIDYEDNIIDYLPDSLANTKGIDQIQIKHLLNHTSGLPWFPENYELTVKPWNNPFKNLDVNHLMRYVKAFHFPEERGFQYSNLGYGLLTFIIENITNQPLSAAINDLIIKDLNTTWDLKEETTVTGHDWDTAFNNWDFPTVTYGIGGIRGSIENMAAYGGYMLALVDSDAEYLDLIFKDSIKFEQPFYHLVGRGWYQKINQEKNQAYIFHGGWTGGFNSFILLDLKEKEGIIVLSNTSGFIDDIAINYVDSTFALRPSEKDFSWLLSDALKKGTDIKTALYSIDQKKLNINRLLEFSRFLSSKNMESSIAINNFIMETVPTNWVAIFEQGKNYVLLEKYEKAKILFEKAIEAGGNSQVIKQQLSEIKQKSKK